MKYREYLGKIEVTETLRDRIERINGQILENSVSLALDEKEDGTTILLLEYEKKDKNERNAGRKRIDVSGQHSSLWRVADVKASMKDIGYEETAKLLGCSKSTLYRRLKELEGKDDWLFY